MPYPKNLYKYRTFDKYASKLFCPGVIYFNLPSKLGDPFELKPVLDGSFTEQSWRKALFSEVCDLNPNWSPEQIAAEVAERSAGTPSESDVSEYKAAYRTQLDEVGVFSTSARWDSIVMWSHYADKHSGFCLELNPQALPDGNELYPVVYTKHRPKINIFSDRDSANLIASQYKNEEWRYEDEWRFVLSPTSDLDFPQEIDVPKGFIVGVILGVDIIDDNRERMFDWVHRVEPAVQVYETFIDDEEYKVCRKPIDL